MHRSGTAYNVRILVWLDQYYVRHRIMLCDKTATLWRVRRDLKLRLRVWWLWNRALIKCLAGTDYEMPELASDDLVIIRSELYPWSPTYALHVLLNSNVEVVLMTNKGAVKIGPRKEKELDPVEGLIYFKISVENKPN
ncbi:hypothetical protein M9H77_01795 [Catharanthus roseus]|uniref:Uncharacterized protein n=1 Tax=Catharanthus roseus TaxID=4058 RepID=A0ACC0C701_CATRO|nr:hypothetical protein M9H77_01795 [Catharanthus roseus]